MDLKDYMKAGRRKSSQNWGSDCEVNSKRNDSAEAVCKADVNKG